MDNQIWRSGDLESYWDEGVDLACYLYRDLKAMVAFAGKLGKASDEKMYVDRAAKLAKILFTATTLRTCTMASGHSVTLELGIPFTEAKK